MGIILSISHWKKSENKINKKFEWGSLEDKKLIKLAIELKYDWKEVAKQISSHEDISTKFLENRYRELKEGPVLPNKLKITEEEDAKILYYLKIYGTRWKLIAKNLPERNSVAVKNRFYSALRGRVKLSKILKSKRKIKKGKTPKKMSLDEGLEEFQGKETYFVPTKSENNLEGKGIDFDCDVFFDFGDDIVEEKESRRGEKSKEGAFFMLPPLKAFTTTDGDFAKYIPERDHTVSSLLNLRNSGYSPIFDGLFEKNFFSPQDPEAIEEEIAKERRPTDEKERLEEMNQKIASLSSLYNKIQKDLEKLSQAYKKG